MKDLFHRALAFVMRHPRAFAVLLLVLVVSVPNIAEAQRCYSTGYGSSCESYKPEDWEFAAGIAMIAFQIWFVWFFGQR